MKNISELLVQKRWIWHVLFWFVYALFQYRNYYITIAYYDVKYLEFMLITRIPFAATVYFTIWLYKRLINQNRYLLYTSLGLITWAGLLAGVVTFQKHHLQTLSDIAETAWSDIYWNQLPSYLVIFILVTMCKYFKDNFIKQHYEREKKNLQLLTELQHLKAQISPHFLFNTMNNFYGLAVEQSKKLPALMVGLSELLRYSLYETNSPTVPLVNEVKYLKNYVELEKIRLEDTLDFEFTIDVDETSKIQIIPLLLVVFVENAFKHAKNVKDEVMRIRIRLAVSEDGKLIFEVTNNCLRQQQLHPQTFNASGIGLENARKRLEAFYPDNQHALTIAKKENEFYVLLKINFTVSE
ncbi:MAG: sensor histidine kinase [Bacteroidia bacterium]